MSWDHISDAAIRARLLAMDARAVAVIAKAERLMPVASAEDQATLQHISARVYHYRITIDNLITRGGYTAALLRYLTRQMPQWEASVGIRRNWIEPAW